MNKTALLASIGLTAIGLAGPAKAQSRYVWDSHAVQVGQYVSDNTLIRTFGDHFDRTVGFFRNSIFESVNFFYESTNCTGQRYLFSGDSTLEQLLVHTAYYENTPSPGSRGKTLWAPVEGQVVAPHKYGSAWQGFETLGEPVGCVRGDDHLYFMTPAVAVDTTSNGFTPPFCVAVKYEQCAIQRLQ